LLHSYYIIGVPANLRCDGCIELGSNQKWINLAVRPQQLLGLLRATIRQRTPLYFETRIGREQNINELVTGRQDHMALYLYICVRACHSFENRYNFPFYPDGRKICSRIHLFLSVSTMFMFTDCLVRERVWERCVLLFSVLNTVQMIHVRPPMNMYVRLDLYWFFFWHQTCTDWGWQIKLPKLLSLGRMVIWVERKKIKRQLNIHETPIKAGVKPGFYFYGSNVQPPFSRR
jgi:hypothetical protein